ncbi:FAD:protein FMN transferase [Neptuniibacter sp. CAU 1671]|uniref:FAD:protein FMN transferase n=1 Tax=Neptuniibacter sp. CAU 1671 TaxID=3032593 RepID=UPI0023DC08E9|nr:FAD:protein FMN transferase [Neptuniibacter sp. CAU 1671]MDF2180820.1 FAD:protein FMN transferase [Neptuniibacter sp. CAU 1671]
MAKSTVSDCFRYRQKWSAALLLAIVFFVVSGCSEPGPQLQTHAGMTMGTTFSVKWVATPDTVQSDLARQIDNMLLAVNQSMSTYIPDSELSLLNKQPAASTVQVSEELGEVLALALQIADASSGAFDVTVGPLVNLWGFGPDGRVTHAPSEDKIAEVRERVGYHKLDYDAESRMLTKQAASYIDLSAIAKGYGVDQVAGVLEQAGISNYLVEIGGELRAKGVKPNGQHWRIAIESPTSEIERTVQRIIEVRDTGIATSGDYRNYFEENGVRFSHTIDPATAAPIHHRLASVTVLAPTCAEADGLATTLMVLGPERGMEFASAKGIKVFMLVKTDNGFEERMSPGFEAFLVK